MKTARFTAFWPPFSTPSFSLTNYFAVSYLALSDLLSFPLSRLVKFTPGKGINPSRRFYPNGLSYFSRTAFFVMEFSPAVTL